MKSSLWTPRTGPTEAEFLRMVLQLAKLRGWYTYHARPARTARGWRTAVQGDGVGWMDLLCVRERVIVAELKVGRGKLTPEQSAWLSAFREAGVGAFVWTPNDWPEIERVME